MSFSLQVLKQKQEIMPITNTLCGCSTAIFQQRKVPTAARLPLSSFNSKPITVPPSSEVCTATVLILLRVDESQIMVHLH
jgi:hypothetical protein